MSQAGVLDVITYPLEDLMILADTGSAMPIGNELEFLGDMVQGVYTAASGNTVTWSIMDASITQKGVMELANDAEALAGAITDKAIVPSTLKLKLGVQTQSAIPYGQTSALTFGWTDTLLNGQLVIGSTSGVPLAGQITSVDGTVDVVLGPGTIDLSVGAETATEFDADTGFATPSGNILNLLGDATQGSATSGSGNTIIHTNLDASETQKGVLETSTDAESIAGASTTVAVVPSSLAAKLGTQTANAVPYGGGSSAAFSWMTPLTDGQLIIGATSGAPAAASLTSTDGSVDITAGTNSLDLSVSGLATAYTNVNSSPYVVLETDYFLSVDTSSTGITIQLPNAPTTKRVYIIKDRSGNAAANNITVTTVGGSVTIDGATSQVLTVNYESIQVLFNGTSYEVF